MVPTISYQRYIGLTKGSQCLQGDMHIIWMLCVCVLGGGVDTGWVGVVRQKAGVSCRMYTM